MKREVAISSDTANLKFDMYSTYGLTVSEAVSLNEVDDY